MGGYSLSAQQAQRESGEKIGDPLRLFLLETVNVDEYTRAPQWTSRAIVAQFVGIGRRTDTAAHSDTVSAQ